MIGQSRGRNDSVTTQDETYRATLRARTPEGDATTVLVLRRGLGHAARVWLTFDGAIKTTAVLTDPETVHLVELLGDAQGARWTSRHERRPGVDGARRPRPVAG